MGSRCDTQNTAATPASCCSSVSEVLSPQSLTCVSAQGKLFISAASGNENNMSHLLIQSAAKWLDRSSTCVLIRGAVQTSSLRGCSCWKRADVVLTQTSKENQRCLSYCSPLHFLVCCEDMSALLLKHTPPPPTHHAIFFTEELFSVSSFMLLFFLFLQTHLNLLNKRLKRMNTVSSQRFLLLFFFYWF